MPNGVSEELQSSPFAWKYANGLPQDPTRYRPLGIAANSFSPLDMQTPVISYSPQGLINLVWPHDTPIEASESVDVRVVDSSHPDYKLCHDTGTGNTVPLIYASFNRRLGERPKEEKEDRKRRGDTWVTGTFTYYNERGAVPPARQVKPLPPSWKDLVADAKLTSRFSFHVLRLSQTIGTHEAIKSDLAAPGSLDPDGEEDAPAPQYLDEDEEDEVGTAGSGVSGVIGRFLKALEKDFDALIKGVTHKNTEQVRELFRIVHEYASQVLGAVIVAHADYLARAHKGFLRTVQASMELKYAPVAGGGAPTPAPSIDLDDVGQLGSWFAVLGSLVAKYSASLEREVAYLASRNFLGVAMTRGEKGKTFQVLLGPGSRTQRALQIGV
jgi:hypothetical protein